MITLGIRHPKRKKATLFSLKQDKVLQQVVRRQVVSEHAAPEACWRRVFDPHAPLLFDLYHYLNGHFGNGHFGWVPEHVLPGCIETRWVLSRIPCGLRRHTSRPGPSGEDAPGAEAIGGLQHKRRTLNTWLSSGTSVRIFVCYAAAGPYRSHWAKQVRKTNWIRILFLAGDKEWLESRSTSRVSNQHFCLFRFQKVQLHWATLRVFYAHSL